MNIAQKCQLLNLSRNAEDAMKLVKCSFSTNNIDWIIHVIRPSRSEIALHISHAIKALKLQTSLSVLFLGLSNDNEDSCLASCSKQNN